MPVADIVRGISESDFITNGEKFDIIEFDCCMMGNFEIALAMQDYTDYYLGCPDVDPFPSLDYTALLNYLGENPEADSKELGRQTVNIYVDWFEQNPGESSINKAVTLCMVDTEKLKNSGIVGHMKTIADIMRREAAQKNFYDEIRSTKDVIRDAYTRRLRYDDEFMAFFDIKSTTNKKAVALNTTAKNHIDSRLL